MNTISGHLHGEFLGHEMAVSRSRGERDRLIRLTRISVREGGSEDSQPRALRFKTRGRHQRILMVRYWRSLLFRQSVPSRRFSAWLRISGSEGDG